MKRGPKPIHSIEWVTTVKASQEFDGTTRGYIFVDTKLIGKEVRVLIKYKPDLAS